MDGIKLTSSEWNVLNCLWEHNPCPLLQLVGELEKNVGWARSTTITVLGRMEAKGLVRCQQTGRSKAYVPLVERESAAITETRSFLDRVYQGSVELMMSAMAKSDGLNREQIAQLRAILDEAEQEVKE